MNTEVKPGYKLTEVGVIPEDWAVTKLSRYVTFKTGPFGSTLHKSDYVDGGVPVINPMQIISGKLEPTLNMTISEDAARRLSDFRLCAGNVVIGRRGEMGRCAFVNKEQVGWLCGTGSMIIRPSSMIDGRFLQRMLSSSKVITAIANASVGSTMINLNQGTLGNLSLAIPPTKAEQEAIAEALSDADALIESLEQLITKKRQIKQGAMQELLTSKKRLPGFSGEWEAKRLGDVVKITKGQLITEINAVSGDVPVIAGGKKPAYFHNKPNRTGKTVTVSASGASAGYVAIFDQPIFASDCSTISEGDNYSIEFIYSQLQLKQEIIFEAQTGGAQPHIHADDLMPIEIGVPSLAEQKAIANILFDMDVEIGALEAKLEKARQLKQGMMHNLLTGKIRLV